MKERVYIRQTQGVPPFPHTHYLQYLLRLLQNVPDTDARYQAYLANCRSTCLGIEMTMEKMEADLKKLCTEKKIMW